MDVKVSDILDALFRPLINFPLPRPLISILTNDMQKMRTLPTNFIQIII